MNAQIGGYAEYKDSGVAWLGEIPAHWEVRRNGGLFAPVKQTGFPGLPILEVSLRSGVQVRDMSDSKRKQFMSDASDYQRALAGDVVYNMMRMWQGAVGVAPIDGLVSPAYVVARPYEGQNGRYYELLFRTPGYQQEVDGYSRGIVKDRNRLYWEQFKSMSLPCPPTDEQAAIVKYLAHVDRKIDRFIRSKRRMIELLNEQKQAIIHQAVTKGLDPSAPMKDSGVEWLGEIPVHWEVRPLGKFITLQRGIDITRDQQVEGGVPVVSSGGISSYHNRGTSEGPGVLVGRKGSAGTVHYVAGAFWAHDTTLWVKEFKGNLPRYIYYLLQQLNLKRFDTGSSNPTINRNLVHPELVALPSHNEQFAIATHIDDAIEGIKRAEVSASRLMSLVTEYRTRLVNDVVIGKLDVRELILPVETECGSAEGEGDFDDEQIKWHLELEEE